MDVEPEVAFREDQKPKEKNITMKTLKLAIMAGVLGLAVQANASFFDLYYSDPSGNVATGQLTATFLGGVQYLATSGTLNLTSASNPGLDGTYSLLPGGPGNVLSPSGQFQYDNVLYYPSDPIVDYSGILGFESSLGVELNLFSTAPGTYGLMTWDPVGGLQDLYPGAVNAGGSAIATLTPVPEPTTIISGVLMLLPFGASTLRILRKKQVA